MLTQLKRVILLDHRDCSAYKLVKGPDHTKNPELEKEMHSLVMPEAEAVLLAKFPHLKVYKLLLGLDGTVVKLK